MSLDFKHVGVVIICLRINATKVITRGWEVTCMLFNAMVVHFLLKEVEMWGGTISLDAWNEIEKIKKQNLT